MTTPFVSSPQTFRGQAPPWSPPAPDPRSRRTWLGDPTSSYGMIQLPPQSKGGLAAPRTRGRVIHSLYGGGVSVTAGPARARSWNYTWPALNERDYQVLQAFDADVFGTPPWCLVEPEGVNRLTWAQSLCSSGWAPTNGTLTTSTAAPYTTPSSVMQWTPAASGNRLIAGLVTGGSGVPDTLHGIPNVPAESITFTVMASVASGSTTAHLRLTGMNADGSGSVLVNGSSGTVGTSWTQLVMVVGPGVFGSLPWVLPSLVSESTTALLLSNPQVSYTPTAMAWGAGGGVPRVLITTELPRDLVGQAQYSGVSMTLTEAIAGAV